MNPAMTPLTRNNLTTGWNATRVGLWTTGSAGSTPKVIPVKRLSHLEGSLWIPRAEHSSKWAWRLQLLREPLDWDWLRAIR
jgi:hypothetical protein